LQSRSARELRLVRFQLRGIDFDFRDLHVWAVGFLGDGRAATSGRQQRCAKN
jgi:hypothetical protein